MEKQPEQERIEPFDIEKSPAKEAYLNRLVYTCNANIYELRRALETCKV